MKMVRTTLIFIFFLMSPVMASSHKIETFSLIDRPVVDAAPGDTVVEFFSFYCHPCYVFSQIYGVDKAIRDILPPGERMLKYHVGFLGSLGDELTRAWSVAIVAGIEEQIEPLLFNAIQKERTLKSAEDIRTVFIKAGMSGEEYDRMLVSQSVTDMTEKQKHLFKEYGVTGTPSVYINGRYRIENNAFRGESVEDFRNSYVSAVRSLLSVKNK